MPVDNKMKSWIESTSTDLSVMFSFLCCEGNRKSCLGCRVRWVFKHSVPWPAQLACLPLKLGSTERDWRCLLLAGSWSLASTAIEIYNKGSSLANSFQVGTTERNWRTKANLKTDAYLNIWNKPFNGLHHTGALWGMVEWHVGMLGQNTGVLWWCARMVQTHWDGTHMY